MNKSNKIVLLIIIIFIIATLAIIFRIFLFENIIKPYALISWFLLRIFILWIDQKIIWGLLIFFIITIFFIKYSTFFLFSEETNTPIENNEYLIKLRLWKSYLSGEINDIEDIKKIKKGKLLSILVSIYASNKRILIDHKLYEAFENREILLPDEIFNFIYDSYNNKHGKIYKWFFYRLNKTEIINYHKELDVFINYLENLLEFKHGKTNG